MTLKTILIYDSPILFEILEELKDKINLNVLTYKKDTLFRQGGYGNNDYIIVSSSPNKIKNCHILHAPCKINDIIEKVNVWFLAKNFLKQSNIKIGKYCLDLNSRKILKNKKSLKLTEKETQLITFIISNNVVSLKDIQKLVWNYSPDLETHTVETHIYRLRKKFLEIFDDNNFINHNKDGYYIGNFFKS